MLIQIEAPDSEPVTLDEIKTREGIDYDNHDAFIRNSISAARRWVEGRTGRVLVEQTWEYRLADFVSALAIPMRPIIGVTSITYIDEDGDEQTVADADYFFVDGGPNAESLLMPVDEWPSDVFSRPDAVRIRFVAGYNDDLGVPEDLKEAIRMQVGHFIENREAVLLSPVRQELQVTPLGLDELVAPYIIPRL